jgi:hypothetical protein
MNHTVLPLTLPSCDCCREPNSLLARRDIADGLWVCPESGQLFQVLGDRLLRTPMPALPSLRTEPPAVPIDLSRSGYA